MYQRLSDVDHVIKRPDTYVGPVEPVTWTNTNINDGELEVIPALYKIFDEVLVNASDNISRGKTTKIEVYITDKAFTVYNDGKCVPVVKHKKEKMWTPTLVFGHLRTSNNYDDKEERLTGGRNGYGAKLANIFARIYKVSIWDHRKKKRFVQTWKDNMSKVDPPEITEYKGTNSRTLVECAVDLEKFGIDSIPEATKAMMKRRVHDLKVCNPSVMVSLNGKEIVMKPDDYVSTFMSDIIFRQDNKRWQLMIGMNETGEFQQQSFVNGIWTRNGGTHVDYVWRQIQKHMDPVLKKLKLKAYEVKRKLSIFLSCKLVNPTFDSQIKETCTLPVAKFGSEFKLQKAFMSAVKSSSFMQVMENMASKKDDKKLSKNDGKKRSSVDVQKLTDAAKAGTKDSHKCTLILTEGDSANALALAGMAVVGSKFYGSYPLKGKILNGYTAGTDKWSKNAVITDVIKSIGLKHGVKYKDVKSLRYGSILVMSDQDTDGFHIRGLVFSLFGSHWPELLLKEGFVKVMRTPLVKAFRGKGGSPVKEFFNEQLAHEYIQEHPEYRYKFYKGLGTSTSKEAKEMFRQLDKYTFPMSGAPDSLQKAFKDEDYAKKWRKDIVTRPPMYEGDRDGRTYDSFVTGPWVEHARASNERSIPDLHDGLKPVQRKILYTMMKRANSEIKVAQLNGKVAMDTHYHHGEMNVGNAIVNMAQDFVGSNNLPYLEPVGQFGTRHKGGSDHASHRYIFTKLQSWVKYAFPEADLPVLEYNNVDGHIVEPHHFVPIIPTLLINGASGIGTGWATDIPKYNPVDVIDAVLGNINELKPWYRGFTGTVGKNFTRGKYSIEDGRMVIEDLPIGCWTSNFKEKLKKLEKNYLRFTEEHTDTTVKFVIHGLNGTDWISKLPLEARIKENWVVFENNRIRKTDLMNVFSEHADARLELYKKRKQHQLDVLQSDINEKTNRMKFIVHALAGDIPITSSNYEACVQRCNELSIDSKYLDIRLRDITTDAVKKLERDIEELKQKHIILTNTTEQQMWIKELEELKNHLQPTNKRKREEIDLTD